MSVPISRKLYCWPFTTKWHRVEKNSFLAVIDLPGAMMSKEWQPWGLWQPGMRLFFFFYSEPRVCCYYLYGLVGRIKPKVHWDTQGEPCSRDLTSFETSQVMSRFSGSNKTPVRIPRLSQGPRLRKSMTRFFQVLPHSNALIFKNNSNNNKLRRRLRFLSRK